MSARKLLLLGLVAVLALTGLFAAACGGDDGEDGKAAMQTALDTIETEMASLTTVMTSGGTAKLLPASR